MALIEYLRPLIMAGGFLFIMVGLNILIAEQPTHAGPLSQLYLLSTYTFYIYLVFVFLSTLVTALKSLANARSRDL